MKMLTRHLLLLILSTALFHTAGAQTTPNLQSVTTSGNTTSNPIEIVGNPNGDEYMQIQNTDATDALARAVLLLSCGADNNGGLYVTNGYNAQFPNTFLIASGVSVTNGLRLSSSTGDISLNPAGIIDLNGAANSNSGLNNTQDRPAVSAGTIKGELRGISGAYGPGGDDGFLRLSAGGGTNASVKSFIDLSGYTVSAAPNRFENITLGTAGTERMRIAASGNVGIGTQNPQSLLAVSGTITSKQVVVTQNNWSDFVFDSAYAPVSLDSLARYVSENKHLPQIPSAAQVTSGGLDLGDMQKLQLQKIEELTLYLIEAERRDRQLQSQLESLQKLVEAQQQKIDALQARVENNH